MSRVCGKCNSRDLEDYEFSHQGEVVVRSAEGGGPILMAFEVFGYSRIDILVKLKEGVLVGPTEIVDCPIEQVKEGMQVELAVRKHRRESNGNWMYGYKWVPKRKR